MAWSWLAIATQKEQSDDRKLLQGLKSKENSMNRKTIKDEDFKYTPMGET
jgi:hypothetical protein